MQIEKMKVEYKKRKIVIRNRDNKNKNNDNKIVKEETTEKNTKSTQAPTQEQLEMLYKDNKLEQADEELYKHTSNNYKYIDLSFINTDILKDKRYKILGSKYCNNKYTLYEYCILSQKYKYIR